MARIARKYIADDGTEFATATEAHAHNKRPNPKAAEFLAGLELSSRKIPEYVRLLNAYDEWRPAA